MSLTFLSYIPLGLELLTAIIAIVTFSKYKNSNEKYFLYFLWYTFLIEILGAVLGEIILVNNYGVYNTFTITSMLFYFYWYYTILKKPSFKKAVIVFSILFSIVSFLSLCFQSWDVYHSYTFVTGALFLLVLTLFHFYQLLNSDEVLIVKYKLSFWISTALLLFYVGMIPLFFLSQYTNIMGLSYQIILLSLNVILYGCYMIGFLWTKKEYNRF
ncbi:MAG: hypothetical protein KDC91_07005 [Flavobacteriaceae bacterium]|nr:hypothetical protein [Flavobacteriaceae bacterium]